MEETAGKGIMPKKRSRGKDESPSSSSGSGAAAPSSGTGSEGGPAASPRPPSKAIKSSQECGRERLKRHRMEIAGRVCIPETWGQEGLLKDLVDRRAFESFSLERLASARSALVRDGRRGNRAEIEKRC